MNFDLSNLVQWFWENKIIIALNVHKTDVVIFRSPRKQITKKIRQKTCNNI